MHNATRCLSQHAAAARFAFPGSDRPGRGVSIETYGTHAEAAAEALNRLILTDNIPVDPEAVDQLMYCREAAADALRQRLYSFGLNTHYPTTNQPAAVGDLRMTRARQPPRDAHGRYRVRSAHHDIRRTPRPVGNPHPRQW